MFLNDVVMRCDVGIDLHSAAIHRCNLPQIRITDGDEVTHDLAIAFRAPAILTSKLREGSLRKSAADNGVPVLLYESGEGLRFDERAIRTGLAGILRVLRHKDMITVKQISTIKSDPYIFDKSTWVRAPAGGLMRLFKGLGDVVTKGERIGVVSDILGESDSDMFASRTGMIIGRSNLPIVNEGDAVIHIARASKEDSEQTSADAEAELMDMEDLFYEDEII